MPAARDAQRRTAGAAQALALILALSLPITPLLALVPNLPQLFQHFAGTPNRDFLVPMIITMPSVCIALLAPVAGTLADRFGRRIPLMLNVVFYSVISVLCGLAPSYGAFIALRMLFGIGMGGVVWQARVARHEADRAQSDRTGVGAQVGEVRE